MHIMRMLRVCVTIAFIGLSTGGCVTWYVDGTLRNSWLADVRKPSQPKDVQLLFQFQTNDAVNVAATDFLKSEVTGLISTSGLFSALSTDPSRSGAILSVSIKRSLIADQTDSNVKGFGALVSFGVVPYVMAEGYICTIEYLPPGAANTVSVTSKHAVYATAGLQAPPPANAIEAVNSTHAFSTVTRQMVVDALKQLSVNPVFTETLP